MLRILSRAISKNKPAKNTPAKNKGAVYEEAAKQRIKRAGFTILAQNYTCRLGEIDIICHKRDTLCFIEVKFRKNNRYGTALEQVTVAKQQKIILAAKAFLNQHKHYQHYAIRFDVIAITAEENKLQFNWLENAFY